MDIINYFDVASAEGVNSGTNYGKAPVIDKIKGIAVVPRGFEVPLASCTDWATLIAYLQDATLNVSTESRLIPIIPVGGVTDNTPDPTESTTGYGELIGFTEKPSRFTFELKNQVIKYTQELMELNNQPVAIYLIGTEWIGGVKTTTGFAPANGNVYKKKIKLNNDKNGNDFVVAFSDENFLGKKLDIIQYPYDGYIIADYLNGLTGVTVEATGGTGSVDIKLTYTANQKSLLDKFNTQIVVGAFSVVNASGVSVTPSAISKNANTGVITLSVVAGTYSIKLATPSALVALSIGSKAKGGFISNTVTGVVVS